MDILKYKIISIINLGYENINIISVKERFNNNDILVLMDNNWHNTINLDSVEEYLIGYKFDKTYFKKIYEFKNISLFEKFGNNQIAFVMGILNLFSFGKRTTYIKIMNI